MRNDVRGEDFNKYYEHYYAELTFFLSPRGYFGVKRSEIINKRGKSRGAKNFIVFLVLSRSLLLYFLFYFHLQVMWRQWKCFLLLFFFFFESTVKIHTSDALILSLPSMNLNSGNWSYWESWRISWIYIAFLSAKFYYLFIPVSVQ